MTMIPDTNYFLIDLGKLINEMVEAAFEQHLASNFHQELEGISTPGGEGGGGGAVPDGAIFFLYGGESALANTDGDPLTEIGAGYGVAPTTTGSFTWSHSGFGAIVNAPGIYAAVLKCPPAFSDTGMMQVQLTLADVVVADSGNVAFDTTDPDPAFWSLPVATWAGAGVPVQEIRGRVAYTRDNPSGTPALFPEMVVYHLHALELPDGWT